jgi:hypothetical protein
MSILCGSLRLPVLTAIALLAGVLTACSSEDEIETTALPDGVVMHVDQSRVARKGREVFVRVENNTSRTLTIERFDLTSPRLRDVTWTGDELVEPAYERDLEFQLPRGRCGADIDAEVSLTYRIDGGNLRRSTGPADDQYGNVALFADRDCAESTLTRAASIAVGEPRVTGQGSDAVLQLPVTLAPTGRSADVSFGGFGSTVLFQQAADSPTDVDVPLRGEAPVDLVMSVVPARCDSHALAEDKVGTLFDVLVTAPGLDPNASFYLPLDRAQRSSFFDFFRSSCGLP